MEPDYDNDIKSRWSMYGANVIDSKQDRYYKFDGYNPCGEISKPKSKNIQKLIMKYKG